MWIVITMIIGALILLGIIVSCAEDRQIKRIESDEAWEKMKMGLGVHITYDEYGRLRRR